MLDEGQEDANAITAREVMFNAGGGVTLAGSIVGRDGDPLIVLLHGGGQTRRSWRNGAQAFARAGYQVVAYDARGHGGSSWSPDGDYTMRVLVDDLRHVLAALPAPAALVGASLGGLTALHLSASSDATAVRALVLVDVAPTINPAGSARITSFMNSRPDGYASIEEAADAVVAYNPRRPRQADTSGLRWSLREADGRFFWHWDPAFLRGRDIKPETFRSTNEAAARALTMPTLLVRGALSDLITVEDVERFRALKPGIEFAEVAGAGHMVAGDRNDAFNNVTLDFLRRADGRDANDHPAV